MFICNKSTEGLFNIEEFLASYSQKSSEKTENEDEKLTFLTMDLFESRLDSSNKITFPHNLDISSLKNLLPVI